jgi:hypothetical protein
MSIDWNEVQQALSPLKNYEDCCQRFEQAFKFSFINKAYNQTVAQLSDYMQKLLLEDSRNRYVDYHGKVEGVLQAVKVAGIKDVQELATKTALRANLEALTERTGLQPVDIAVLLKFLVYWFIPNQKYLSGLVQEDPSIQSAIQTLRQYGVRTNLEMLEKGIDRKGRNAIAEDSGISYGTIAELVNRADFSRLPWSSKATISNVIGAGYPSLADLRNADPEKLYADFFAYGRKIGKNLKLGNEIENSYRIAKIIPQLVGQEQLDIGESRWHG